MSESKRLNQCITALLATGFALATGVGLGWSNPVEPKAKKGDLGFPVSNDDFSWIGSALPLGAIVACIPTGFLMDSVGRKMSAILLVIPYTLGYLQLSFAKANWMLITGRTLVGVGCGATCVVIPMYTAEIAEKEIRGALGSFFQLQITIGVLLVFIYGAFLKILLMNIVCCSITIVFAITMVFLPESPWYLIKKEKTEKALKAFAFLRGKDYDAKPEMDKVKADIEASKAENTSFFQGFKSRACMKALYISLGLMFFQQFSGINAIIFYSTEIFKYAGSTLDPRYSTIIIGVVQVVATLMAVLFVDKLGRRLLLLLSAIFMALSTFTLGVYFFMQQRDASSIKAIGWVPLTALCIYIITFSLGFGPVPWLMVGELFPPEVKGPAGSLGATSNWLGCFIVSKLYPVVKDIIGTGVTFWVFCGLTVLAALFVLFLVPETKNKSLTEIQEILRK